MAKDNVWSMWYNHLVWTFPKMSFDCLLQNGEIYTHQYTSSSFQLSWTRACSLVGFVKPPSNLLMEMENKQALNIGLFITYTHAKHNIHPYHLVLMTVHVTELQKSLLFQMISTWRRTTLIMKKKDDDDDVQENNTHLILPLSQESILDLRKEQEKWKIQLLTYGIQHDLSPLSKNINIMKKKTRTSVMTKKDSIFNDTIKNDHPHPCLKAIWCSWIPTSLDIMCSSNHSIQNKEKGWMNALVSVSSKHVIIMRGIPGSGKSSFVSYLVSYIAQQRTPISIVVCTADDYFYHPVTNKYVFKASLLSKAHLYCQRTFQKALLDSINVIIIDNTNVCCWEYEQYREKAQAAGYHISVIELSSNAHPRMATLFALRNSHQVPLKNVMNMFYKWEIETKLTTTCIHTTSTYPIPPIVTPSKVLAVELTPVSQNALLNAFPPRFVNRYGHHCTLVFQPSLDLCRTTPVGARVLFEVIGHYISESCQAVVVDIMYTQVPMRSVNRYPHITLSTTSGTNPSAVNSMLVDVIKDNDSTYPLVLEGYLGLSIGYNKFIHAPNVTLCPSPLFLSTKITAVMSSTLVIVDLPQRDEVNGDDLWYDWLEDQLVQHSGRWGKSVMIVQHPLDYRTDPLHNLFLHSMMFENIQVVCEGDENVLKNKLEVAMDKHDHVQVIVATSSTAAFYQTWLATTDMHFVSWNIEVKSIETKDTKERRLLIQDIAFHHVVLKVKVHVEESVQESVEVTVIGLYALCDQEKILEMGNREITVQVLVLNMDPVMSCRRFIDNHTGSFIHPTTTSSTSSTNYSNSTTVTFIQRSLETLPVHVHLTFVSQPCFQLKALQIMMHKTSSIIISQKKKIVLETLRILHIQFGIHTLMSDALLVPLLMAILQHYTRVGWEGISLPMGYFPKEWEFQFLKHLEGKKDITISNRINHCAQGSFLGYTLVTCVDQESSLWDILYACRVENKWQEITKNQEDRCSLVRASSFLGKVVYWVPIKDKDTFTHICQPICKTSMDETRC